jgi:DegV family protein with EDD domain
MEKIAIVTDSGANLTPEQIGDFPIQQVPFQIIWGEEVYQDGVDLSASAFYNRLETDKVFPTTSQPQPAKFYNAFKSFVEQGYQVLGIITSSGLSGSFSSAVQACKMLPNAMIQLVDSKTIAMELGFQVLAAVRAAAQGATLTECKQIAEDAREKGGTYFVVNTLDYLHRGGRIGGAAAFLGNLLSIKPILNVIDGRIDAVGKVRTTRKAVESMLAMVTERIKNHATVRICALYANERERAVSLLESSREHLQANGIQVVEAFCSQVSPVIGTHTGPDGVGLVYTFG